MGSAVSLGEQGPQEEREFDSFYERARCGWSARGVRGAWEARSETDAGVSLLGSSVRSLGCARWAESDMHHPPPRPPCCPRPVHARARRFSAPVPSRPGGCRRLPGDFFGPASCPSRARCGPSVAGKPSRTGSHRGGLWLPHHERPRAASWRGGPARQGSGRVLFTLSLQASLENASVG